MVGSQSTQDTGSGLPAEQILQMFKELKGLIKDNIKENKDIFEGSFQCTQKELGQTTNALKMTPAIVDKHVLAKKIELPSSQSNGEDSPLDQPTSKEETTLSINDKEPEVEAGEIIDN
ncbi:hypothetical protein ACLB2K_031489 [Fragaria x ananassa]